MKPLFPTRIPLESKIIFVVIDGHTLGYINPRVPYSVQVLRCSVLKGAPFQYLPESMVRRVNDSGTRLAKVADFEEFRVRLEDYSPYPDEYQIPAE